MWPRHEHAAAGIENTFSTFESFATSFSPMNVRYISKQRDGIRGQENTNSFEEVPMRKPTTYVPCMQRNGVRNFMRCK
jgi:hypothetical protein